MLSEKDLRIIAMRAEIKALMKQNVAMREMVTEMVEAFWAEVSQDDPTIAKARAILAQTEE